MEPHLQTEKTVENKWYESIIKLCCVGLQQTTHGHSQQKRDPVLQEVAGDKCINNPNKKRKINLHQQLPKFLFWSVGKAHWQVSSPEGEI